MTPRYGFAGKILHVDLGTGDAFAEPLDATLATRFIGGVGISSWLAYNLIDVDTDPFAPDNALIYGVSPLAGTLAPGASRVYITSRSPDSGFICHTNAGQSAGVMLKYAGYDALVITGRADAPVYLRITDDEVALSDATQLWGMDGWETTRRLHTAHPDHWIDCIGPAAERRVRYAIVLCNMRSSFNKTGAGSIMGSKHLKAIVAHGTQGVRVADPDRFLEASRAITRRVVVDPTLPTYRRYGGPLRDRAGFTRRDFAERVVERPYACLGCPVACKHTVHLRDGPYQGLRYRISHLGALAGHNRLGGPEDWDELVKVVERENRSGVEASVISGLLHYLHECHAHGVLSEEKSGFTPSLGGSPLRALIERTTTRQGIGAVTAEGFTRLIDWVDADSERHAQHHKSIGREHGLDREVSLFTIGALTNPRGGKAEFAHIPVRGGNSVGLSPSEVGRFCADLRLRGDAAERIRRGPGGVNVPRLLKWVEDYSTAYMCVGFCYRPPLMNSVDLTTLSHLYEALTGCAMSPAAVLRAGERVFNVIKAFNVKMGATRIDDLPSRGTTWQADVPITRRGTPYGTLNQILDEYYDERGWTVATGVPTRGKLAALGLAEVADALNA